jgi:hypothetical protein
VAALDAGELSAVYSVVELDEFVEDSADNRTGDPAWIIPWACQHQQVIAEVMKSSPVLPLRFGVIFSSLQVLAELMAEKAREISRFLDEVSDKEEWSVKVFMDKNRAPEQLLSTDAGLLGQSELTGAPPGTRYLQEKRLRAEAQKLSRRCCRTAVDEIAKQLGKFAVQARRLKAQPRELSARNEEMVLNYALLLYRRRTAELREQVEVMCSQYTHMGLAIELTGPWPPYNFCPPTGKALR